MIGGEVEEVLELWLKRVFGKSEVSPPQEVPRDTVRKTKRLEAEKQTLRSMRRLAINESDPQFLSYVIQREAELDHLIEAQLDEEYDVITDEKE